MNLLYFFGCLLLILVGISALNDPNLFQKKQKPPILKAQLSDTLSPAAYDSIGLVFQENQAYQEALENFEKAVEMGQNQNDNELAIYQMHLERLQKQLE